MRHTEKTFVTKHKKPTKRNQVYCACCFIKFVKYTTMFSKPFMILPITPFSLLHLPLPLRMKTYIDMNLVFVLVSYTALKFMEA